LLVKLTHRTRRFNFGSATLKKAASGHRNALESNNRNLIYYHHGGKPAGTTLRPLAINAVFIWKVCIFSLLTIMQIKHVYISVEVAQR